MPYVNIKVTDENVTPEQKSQLIKGVTERVDYKGQVIIPLDEADVRRAVDELAVSIIAPPEGSNFATFTPTKAGTYTYYCDICCGGRANPTMQGTLIVEG